MRTIVIIIILFIGTCVLKHRIESTNTSIENSSTIRQYEPYINDNSNSTTITLRFHSKNSSKSNQYLLVKLVGYNPKTFQLIFSVTRGVDGAKWIESHWSLKDVKEKYTNKEDKLKEKHWSLEVIAESIIMEV